MYLCVYTATTMFDLKNCQVTFYIIHVEVSIHHFRVWTALFTDSHEKFATKENFAACLSKDLIKKKYIKLRKPFILPLFPSHVPQREEIMSATSNQMYEYSLVLIKSRLNRTAYLYIVCDFHIMFLSKRISSEWLNEINTLHSVCV